MKKLKRMTILVLLTLCVFSTLTLAKTNYGKRAGEKYRLPINSTRATMYSGDIGTPNYYESIERYQLRYEGYIQFQPSYYTQPLDRENKLEPYNHVKQAFIDYERNDRSVSDGTNYTTEAYSPKDNAIYSTSITAKDSLIPGSQNTTYFVVRWFYFTYQNR